MRKLIQGIAVLPVCLAMILNSGSYMPGNILMANHTVNVINQTDNNRKAEVAAPQLLKDASVETSAMCLWEHNNNTTECCWLFDRDEEQEIVNYLNGIKLGGAVKDVDTDKLSGIMYSVEIGAKDGTFISFIWYDGYVFFKDGSVYKADIDFDRIKNYSWEETDKMQLSSFPNIRCIAIKDGKWNTNFLCKSKKNKAHGLKISNVKLKGAKLEVKLKNKTKKEICYGEYFSIQAKVDGCWYDIPAKEEMAFNAIAYIMKAKGNTKKTYDLTPYGELPSGKYRIIIEGASAEFNI